MSAGGPPARPPFAWPPRPATAAAPPRAQGPTRPAPASPPRTAPPRPWWCQVEETWLGLIAPPFPRRALDAGWQPDHPTAYCPRCARSTGAYDSDADGCAECRGRTLPWDRAVRLGEYRGLLREALHELKFSAWRKVGRDLGSLLGSAVAEAMRRAGLGPDDVLVVPVPTTFRRRMARGIDHSLVLARAVAAAAGCDLCKALERRHMPPQTAFSAAQRAVNVRGTMWRRPGISLAGRTLILVDDIMTTGATMATASRGLTRRPGGTSGTADRPESTWAAVVAVTPVPGARQVGGDGVERATGGVLEG